jgi:MFS family permease
MNTSDRGARGSGLGPARRAVSLCFLLNGVVIASWLPHIPDLKSRLAIGDGALGLLLLAMAAGAIAALPTAGWLIDRMGSRVVTATSAAALSLAVVPPVLSPSVATSAAALALLGACNATLDVAMNAQGVMVEHGYGRPIMSSFHALFSLGGLLGAGGAAAIMAAGLSATTHVIAVALLSLAAVGVAARSLMPAPRMRDRGGSVFVLPPSALLGLGLLTFCALLAEGAVGDWSAVYLRDSLGTTPAAAAFGFAAFSLAMTLGRLAGDSLARRLGGRRLLRLSGALAAGGLCLALLLGQPAVALLGFGLVGLGVANLIPVLFSAAGRARGMKAGTAIAAVATTGYCGYLAGPLLIGLAADAAGLPAALGIVCAACALVATGAAFISPPRDVPASSGPVTRDGFTAKAEGFHHG